ncbi:MAG TPA: segregation/condensation protein A [Polyangiaceae bacterium]|nr:segregation/condensation protein A [Polyangiaceae bacterium]
MTDAPDSPPPAEGGPLPQGSDATAGGAGGYRVQLPTFEGPLDLLLHLIEEHELDIRDIPISFIAAKYVEYITLMEELNIDVASEYLVMAATLTHIKSKMLLPTPPTDQDEDGQEIELDPRAELVRRLLEYQKYKQAAEQLSGGSVLGRDVFLRGLPAPSVEGPAPIAGLSLFKLLDAFQAVLSRAKTTVEHQIDFERFSITDRINELSDILRDRRRMAFEELFAGQGSRGELIITFLALLEMTRLRLTRLLQEGPLEPITVELTVSEDEDFSADRDTVIAEDEQPSKYAPDVEESESEDAPGGDDDFGDDEDDEDDEDDDEEEEEDESEER